MKIIVLSKVLDRKHIGLITEAAEGVGAQVTFVENESDIPADFADAEVLYGFGTETARTSKALKWLCVPSAGVDYMMGPGKFANEDCILTNSSGAYGVTIAEHIIGVTLMMMRRLTEFYAETSRGEWGAPRAQKSIKDCRITVLGTGDIGTEFAKRAKAFEPASIIGINRSGATKENVYDEIKKIGELDQALTTTDLLVMSLPDTPETKGILSRERIAMLPEGAFIVNVGRGSAIDEEALADSLDEGRIASAALDVFAQEPLPKDSRLWHTKNLLITPHVAGNQTLAHTMDRNVEMFLEDLQNYASGRPLAHAVDRQKGY